MKKKVISIMLMAAMVLGNIPTHLYAASLDSKPTKIELLDLFEGQESYEKGTLEFLGNGTVLVDGEESSVEKALGLSSEQAGVFKEDPDKLEDFLVERSYDIHEEADGVIVAEDTFSTKRIYVTGVSLDNYYGAQTVVESGGVSLLTYSSKQDAKNAFDNFKKNGYEVYPDEVIGDVADASNVSYGGDVLGQYNVTVKDSTNKISTTLAPELMSLTVCANNIVGQAGSAEIHDVGVAVLDSGIDTTNDIFKGRVKGGHNVLNGASTYTDSYGHGTFIASEILNNTPSNVYVVPIKVTDDKGMFTASRLAASLEYINSNSTGINVVNLSLSVCSLDSNQMDQLSSFIDPYIDALYDKGIQVVTSAGNRNSSFPEMTADDSYPANYDKCVAVGSLAYTSKSNSWGLYSNSLTGKCVDYVAPGRYIRGVKAKVMGMEQATADTNWKGEWIDLGDGTCLMSGTSQSAAFISAALANILSYNTSLSANEQYELLKKNTTKYGIATGSDKDIEFGYGYPEMSAYTYSTGIYNAQSGGYSGLIADFDVVVDKESGTVEIKKYTGTTGTVVLKDSYVINGQTLKTVIGHSTSTTGPFVNNSKIQSVFLDENVCAKDNDASYMFYGCSGLTAINRIPNGALDISYMFYGDKALLQLPDVPKTVIKMDYAFCGCSSASGVSNIESSDVISATDAYKGDTVTIKVPTGSTTEKTIVTNLPSWEGVKLDGAKDDATDNENNESGSGNGEQAGSEDIIHVENITFDKHELTIAVGETAELVTLVTPENATTQGRNWKSSDEKVATVDGAGTVVGVSSGNAMISVSCDGRFDYCLVTVKDKNITGTDNGGSDTNSNNNSDIINGGSNDNNSSGQVDNNAGSTEGNGNNATGDNSGSSTPNNNTGNSDPNGNTNVNPGTGDSNSSAPDTGNNGDSSTIPDTGNTSGDENVCIVTFHYREMIVNEEGTDKTVKVKYGDSVKKPSSKKIAGYYFAGWYTKGGKKYDFASSVVKSIDLYGKWISKNIKKPVVIKVKKVASKKFTVNYKKVSGAQRYHILYTTDKSWKTFQVVSTKSLKKTIKTRKSGTYYIKVKAGRKLGKKWYWTRFPKAYKVTV